ncbi:unnamed protein product [Mytilus coruscus]|uniref:BTB domain-containing protein n=1 Tax=Mytilus coruscus TaxID=42192 RepID=A0A6J8DQD9_MYTCO|nr:unnamed protein product [Mytilus coruscus]
MLSAFVSKNQKDWDDYIALLMMAYRSSEHQTTEISPYEMVFGRQITLPVDMAMGVPSSNYELPTYKTDYAYKLSGRINKIHEFARDRIKMSSDNMKRTYDRSSQLKIYKENDLVWLFNKSKPEYNKRRNEYINGNYTIPKKARQEVANKENISLPIGNVISPIRSLSSTEKQERRIILAPKELIVPPNPASYPPVLIPPPQSVSTSVFDETTITNENVVINDNFSEENTENNLNSCVISICPRQEEYNLQLTETEEYIIELPDIPNETPPPSYSPTPTHILLLRGLNEAHRKRIILNIGGTKFESFVQNFQNDPSSLLSRMLAPDSPFQLYIQEPHPSYFLDRDPRHFVHILNYLRSNCSSELSIFPRNIVHLRELQKEATFYKLEHLCTLLENRCLEILQGTVDRDII